MTQSRKVYRVEKGDKVEKYSFGVGRLAFSHNAHHTQQSTSQHKTLNTKAKRKAKNTKRKTPNEKWQTLKPRYPKPATRNFFLKHKVFKTLSLNFATRLKIYLKGKSGYGEIGRRTRLRIWRRKACRFDPYYPHKFS